MKILFISYYFAPANAVASIRTTKIVKYLEKNGFIVDVICGKFPIKDEILERDIEGKRNIFYIDGFKFIENLRKYKRETSQKSPKLNWKSFILKISNKILDKIFGLEKYFIIEILNSYFFFQNAKKLKININQYDFIVSSFGPVGSLLLANYYKKKNPKVKYILDLRDPIIPEYINSGILKFFLKIFEEKTFNLLDYAVVVSEGLKEYLIDNGFKKGISVITNGYDLEDISFVDEKFLKEIEKNNSDKITFCYTGTLYEGKRDISKLFLALKQLINEGKIQEDKISIYYAGKDEDIFLNTAKIYNLDNISKSYGFLPRKKSLALQAGSDILVLATWNTNKEKGVLTGKLFEYMMFKKPILALVSGNKKAEIDQILKNLTLSLVYYNEHDDIKNLKDYILKVYNIKILQDQILTEYNEAINEYNYRNIVKKYTKILEDIKNLS